MSALSRFLFKIARSPVSAFIIGTAFEILSPVLPLDRRYEDNDVVVIPHPNRSRRVHLVAVSKKRVPSFLALSLESPAMQRIALSILRSLQILMRETGLQEAYIMVNGGIYQHVPQIHFHLMSDPSQNGAFRSASNVFQPPPSVNVQRTGGAIAFPYPQSPRSIHYIVTPEAHIPGLCRFDFENPVHTAALLDVWRAAQIVAAAHSPDAYMVGAYLNAAETDSRLAFHVISGNHRRKK